MFFFKKVRGKGVGVGFSLPYRGKKKSFFYLLSVKKSRKTKKKQKKKYYIGTNQNQPLPPLPLTFSKNI